jgi:hypothetical protein
MLPNEEFALGCRAWYEEQGLIVDETNGEFAHCPQPEKYGDTGYYLLHGHHQQQGLLQSKDIGECCFFSGHTKKWLLECEYFPENYFELWDIYEEYVRLNGAKGAKKAHSQRDDLGRSVLGVRNAERAHRDRDEQGRSILGVKNAKRLHRKKTKDGKSVSSSKAGKASRKNKTGIHNPEYRNSPEYKEINRNAGKNGGGEGVRRQSGIHNPAYRASPEYLEMRSAESKKLVERRVGMFDPEFKREQNERRSKPVVFHFPDGGTLSFPSRMEAIRQMKISSSTLVRVLRNGKVIRAGRFKGVRITEGNG